MPRQARTHCDTGVYHVMIRGNERKKIFLDNEDRKRFVRILFDKSDEEKAEIYAFCLMDNHVHLLIQKEHFEIAKLMQRINVSFAYYFNKKYKRIGHLFQDRFKSEIVENDDYLLAAVRYIHNNPVKAGMVKSPEMYFWSSYLDYIDKEKRNSSLITDKVLSIYSNNVAEAKKLFIEFGNLDSDINFIEFMEKNENEIRAEKEKQAKDIVNHILSEKNIDLENINKRKNASLRNELIVNLRDDFELSSRQIALILNINKNTVLNVLKSLEGNIN